MEELQWVTLLSVVATAIGLGWKLNAGWSQHRDDLKAEISSHRTTLENDLRAEFTQREDRLKEELMTEMRNLEDQRRQRVDQLKDGLTQINKQIQRIIDEESS